VRKTSGLALPNILGSLWCTDEWPLLNLRGAEEFHRIDSYVQLYVQSVIHSIHVMPKKADLDQWLAVVAMSWFVVD
jgi:hypothetical protein